MLLSQGSCLDKYPGMHQIPGIETMNDYMLPQNRGERSELQYRSLNRQQKEIIDIVLNAIMHELILTILILTSILTIMITSISMGRVVLGKLIYSVSHIEK